MREFAGEAAAGGALVLYGACDAVVRRRTGPFVEALELLVRAADPATCAPTSARAAASCAAAARPAGPRVGELPQPVAADQDTERHRLHMAVVELLIATGRRAPVLLVSRTATGPTTRRCCSCAISAGRPPTRGS